MQSWGFSRAQTVGWFLARAFPIAAFVALLLLRRHWARLIPVTSLLAYATLLHAITHAEARLSDPFRPLLFVIVAVAICCRVAPTAVTRGTEGAHPQVPG